MIGTRLLEELVQSTVLTHLIRGYDRASLLLIAAPENGKTTISTAAHVQHVLRVAAISGRSVVRELLEHKEMEFLLFNDMGAIRSLSVPASNLLITLLNQLVQGEKGIVAFAGKETEKIDRCIGLIGCLPFETFRDHRAKWRTLGFISRMLPVAYAYSGELAAEIKDAVDKGTQHAAAQPYRKMKRSAKRQVRVEMNVDLTRKLRHMVDAKALTLGQLGIRLLKNYHVIIRAHALLMERRKVEAADFAWLKQINEFVSTEFCRPLEIPE